MFRVCAAGASAVVPSAHATIVACQAGTIVKNGCSVVVARFDLYIQCRSFRHLHTRRSRRWSNKIHRLGLPLHRSCRHRGRCIQCIQSRTTRHLLMHCTKLHAVGSVQPKPQSPTKPESPGPPSARIAPEASMMLQDVSFTYGPSLLYDLKTSGQINAKSNETEFAYTVNTFVDAQSPKASGKQNCSSPMVKLFPFQPSP